MRDTGAGRMDAGPRRAAGPSTATVVIAHLSDLHLGAHDADAVERLPADVAAFGPALTVVTGDWTMRARIEEFRQARRLLDRLPRPVLAVTGNHDVPLFGPRRVIDPYTRYRRWIVPELDPVVRGAGLTALGLQSTPRWRWANGRISARQADDVVRTFGAAPPGDLRLLALHHPPLASHGRSLLGRARLIRAIEAAGVDLVLAGHTHVPDVRGATLPAGGEAYRPVAVVAGTTTSVRTRGAGLSWSLISVAGDAVVVRERYLGGSGWNTGRLVHCRLGSAAAS